MARVDLAGVRSHRRGEVEKALTVRYRPDDGHSGSATLADMIESDRFLAKGVRRYGTRRQFGLLMTWPGTEPLFLGVPKVLWDCVDLPVEEGTQIGADSSGAPWS